MKIGEWAEGKWPQIISRLLGEDFINHRKNGPCPKGEGVDRYRFADPAKYTTGCFFCACSDGRKTGFDLLMCVRGWDFKTTCREVEAVIGKTPDDGKMEKRGPSYAERLQREARPEKRSRYLESRGLEVAPGLRFCKAVDYYDANGNMVGKFPAMLAPVMRGEAFLTYHATYLAEGKKAPVTPNRKILPGPTNVGASCPLYPAAEVMGVGEGIETCIAAKMLTGTPTWAALNTSLLRTWEPPAIAKKVFIFGDNDANLAGQAAAYHLGHRLKMLGLEIVIELPNAPDTDWNDVAMELAGRKVA